MRLLIANTHRRLVGGIETYLRSLLPALVKRGHEVAFLHERTASGDRGTVDEWAPGLSTFDAQRGGVAAALAWAREQRPDVCFIMGLHGTALEEGLLGVAPSVLFAQVYHGGCISGFKRYAVPTLRPCERAFGPGCLALYYPRRCGGLNPRSMWREYRAQARRRAFLPRYHTITVASRWMRREYAGLVLPEERVVVTPLFPGGLVPDAQPPAPKPVTGRVVMFGRLTPLKGGTLLVRALAEASRALGRPLSLEVAGDGEDRGPMEALAKKRGMNVQFVGWADDARREALLRTADVLAVPSVWPEPFGMVGVEAGCLGVPAVGFAVGGIPDWLEPGVSGELAPGTPPTVRGLSEALVRALRDEAHLQTLREGAWRVAQRFTPDAYLERLLPVLRAAAGQAP